MKRGYADQQVSKWNNVSGALSIGINLRSSFSHVASKRFYRDCGENRVEVVSPLLTDFRIDGAMESMLQFNRRNGGQYNFGFLMIANKVSYNSLTGFASRSEEIRTPESRTSPMTAD